MTVATRLVSGQNSSLCLYIIWAVYILGLCSSWGTSRICPAWSPSEHQLTPALSLIWGLCPKPRRPEEVVYSPNDSCSHFAQRPETSSATYMYCFLWYIRHHSYLLYITSMRTIIPFYLYDIFTLSLLQILMAGRLPSVLCVWYSYSINLISYVIRSWWYIFLKAPIYAECTNMYQGKSCKFLDFFKYSEITDTSVGSIGSRLIIGKLLFCWVEKLNYWISLGWERVAQPFYYFFSCPFDNISNQ